jgi:hypothetical protein
MASTAVMNNPRVNDFLTGIENSRQVAMEVLKGTALSMKKFADECHL